MLKNVRNAFGQTESKDIMRDAEGREIAWKYVRELADRQKEEGLRYAPKFNDKHIRYEKNVMSVRLAAQTLSRSVARALGILKVKERNFGNVDGTIRFITVFNNVFDMLNCRTLYSDRAETHKIPLTENNRAKLKAYAEEYKSYIRGLRCNEKEITQYGRRCGFVGFLICLENIFPLHELLKDNYGMDYVLTHKLLQDHIENFFSAIRMRGGFNNNPSAFQFKCAYRRLLIHHQIRSADAANCLADDLPILNVSSSSSHIAEDEPVYEVSEELFNFDCMDYVPSSFVRDVAEYIAGYAIFKIEQNFAVCTECVNQLQDPENKCIMIEIKNEGPLKTPAEFVVELCLTLERYIRDNADRVFHSAFVDQCIDSVRQTGVATAFEGTAAEPEHAKHRKMLVKLIAQNYLRTRMRHEAALASEVDNRIRRTYTKLIHFKNQ